MNNESLVARDWLVHGRIYFVYETWSTLFSKFLGTIIGYLDENLTYLLMLS